LVPRKHAVEPGWGLDTGGGAGFRVGLPVNLTAKAAVSSSFGAVIAVAAAVYARRAPQGF
jgi:hypothetical protein